MSSPDQNLPDADVDTGTVEAAEADVVEQQIPVPADDDDYPHTLREDVVEE